MSTQLQPLMSRIKEIGASYGKSPTQLLHLQKLGPSPNQRYWYHNELYEHGWSSLCSSVSGVSELADLPGERGADPRGQECQPGQGVRWRSWVEPDQRRGRRASDSGARDQGHQDAHRGVVNFLHFTLQWYIVARRLTFWREREKTLWCRHEPEVACSVCK